MMWLDLFLQCFVQALAWFTAGGVFACATVTILDILRKARR